MIDTIEYNGFTFDKTNANIQGVVGNGMPDIRATDDVKSQQDGGIATGYRFGNRTFGWSGDIVGSTPALYLAERIALMGAISLQNQPLEGLTMTFNLITGDVWTLREVRVVDANFDLPEGEPSRTWNSYQVTFRSTFPFFEGTETDESQQVTSSDYGVVVPAPVPSPLTSTVVASSPTDPLSLTNAGNANAYPIFTITGPGTTFTVSNSTTGHSMTISTTLAAGQTISIDPWNKTVTKDGSNILSTFSGAWIYLQPGINTLAFSVTSGSDVNTTLRTVFKNTYLGI